MVDDKRIAQRDSSLAGVVGMEAITDSMPMLEIAMMFGQFFSRNPEIMAVVLPQGRPLGPQGGAAPARLAPGAMTPTP